MATAILLPRLGQGMESGTLVRWLKAEGERVEKGEPLYELDTEKVTQEVEAEASGVVLRLLAQEGEEVAVGATVCLIGEPGEDVGADVPAATPPDASAAAPQPDAAATTAADPGDVRMPAAHDAPVPTFPGPVHPASGRIKASPLARRMAKERGIDLAGVAGTGPDGRIVAEDVERAALGHPTPAPVAGPGVPATDTKVGEVVALGSMRRTIARRMSAAWQAPHFMVTMSADMTRAIALREALVARTPEGGVRPTFSDVLTRLVAAALGRHPDVNAHYADDRVTRWPSANVGLAIAVEGGLVVPVIQACERKTIEEIAAARADLVARARAGRLTAADFDGGTFTISNLGMYGVERFVAVLNPPQVAILAVGAIEDRVVAEAGQAVVRPRLELTLSCDHRAIDGAQGSEFLATLKRLLEEPALAL